MHGLFPVWQSFGKNIPIVDLKSTVSLLAFVRGFARSVFGLSQRFYFSHNSLLCNPFEVLFSRQKEPYDLLQGFIYCHTKIHQYLFSLLGVKSFQIKLSITYCVTMALISKIRYLIQTYLIPCRKLGPVSLPRQNSFEINSVY